MLTNLRFWAFLSAGIFVSIIILSIIGHLIEPKLEVGHLDGRRTAMIVQSLFFILFLAFAFSFAPAFLGTFLFLQQKIGNGGHFLVAFLLRHQARVVISVWLFWLLGLLIASPQIIRLILRK